MKNGRRLFYDSNESCFKELKNISDYLNKKLKPMGFIRLPYSLREGRLGADFHYGGTIPKVKVNKLANALFSDHLGRPNNLKNVHVVDASTLNSCACKNYTRKIMINSYGIANKISMLKNEVQK